VTIPALLALGVLAGSLAVNRPGRGTPHRKAAVRAGALAVTTLCLAAFAASVIVPRIAAADADRALLLAASGTPRSLDAALAQARRSSQLDPLSDAGLRAAATIQIHRDDFSRARADLTSALARQPSDGAAWQELSYADLALHRDAERILAVHRALAADPEGPSALGTAASAALSLAAPAGSATATPGSVR